jgi:4-hydroxybenzoate polyprenyltransferase
VRFPEFAHFILLNTLIAARLADAGLDWRLPAILVVNMLAAGAGFVVNEVEDAPADALHPLKRRRNPVAAGRLSRRAGLAVAAAFQGVALLLSALLGPAVLAVSLVSAVLGWAYSWRSIRLKAMPVVDLLEHSWGLAGQQFALTYLALGGNAWNVVWPVLVALMLVSMYGQFYNELHDIETDRRAGIRTTAVAIGARPSRWLMYALLTAGLSLFVLACWQGVLPWWLFLAPAALLGALVLWRRLVAWLSLGEWLPALVALPAGKRMRDARGQRALDLTGSLQLPTLYGVNVVVIIWFVLGLLQ